MRQQGLPTEFIEFQRAPMRAAKAFASAIAIGHLDAIAQAMQDVEKVGAWRLAMKKVAKLQNVEDVVRSRFLGIWIEWGDTIRDSVNSDLDLASALRMLLPRYTGSDCIVYRGDSAINRRRRTYGLSWSMNRDVAETFAHGMWRTCQGGSVVLCTQAPAKAIICAAHLHLNDIYQEAKLLVDRRLLSRVEVLSAYGQVREH